MAMLAGEVLDDGAAVGHRVKAEAGLKMTRDEYVALRRSFDSLLCYNENGEALAARALPQFAQRLLHQHTAVPERIGHPVAVPDQLHL